MIIVSRVSVFCTIITLLTTLSGCEQSSEPNQSGSSPGEFRLTWLKGLRKSASTINFHASEMTQQTVFDLGDVNGSTDFYFALSNVGASTITQLSISVSDSSFLVFPTEIDSLLPTGSFGLEDVSEFPLLRLSAIHGGGPVWQIPLPIMSAGPHSTNLQVRGETMGSDGSPQEVELTVQMDINALLMDAIVWDGSTMIDLLESDGEILVGGFVIPDFVHAYQMSDTARIENTGNVPIYITEFVADLEDTLNPGESVKLAYGVNTHVRFNNSGIVHDLSRFPTYSDGQSYIYLFWQW